MHQVAPEAHFAWGFALLLGAGLLIGLPALIGFAFGKKVAAISAIATVFLALLVASLLIPIQEVREDTIRARNGEEMTNRALRTSRPQVEGAGEMVAERPLAEASSDPTPNDPAVQAYALLLSDRPIVSDRARPVWADQAPGLDHGIYRQPVKSGLYSTQEECRQALAAVVAQAVTQYGRTYLAGDSTLDISLLPPDWFRRSVWFPVTRENYEYHDQSGGFSDGGNRLEFDAVRTRIWRELSKTPTGSASTPLPPFPEVKVLGRASLIEQPLYSETVETSVGSMQQLYALLEFGDYPRAQMRDALRQTAVPRRLRWAASGFAAVLAIIGVLLTALRFDLASDGRHRARLRWATALTILLVVAAACGMCSL